MPETRPDHTTLALRNEVTDVAGSTILSVTSEAALFRKSNLLSPLRSRRWRSTSNAQQQIVGQFASAIVPRQTALIDSNLDTPAGDIESALAALTVWLRAYDIAQSDNTAVAAWTSVGSNTAAFAQGTGLNQPTYQTAEIDNKPIVRFDGNDYLDFSAGVALGTTHTIAFVVKLSSILVSHRIMGGTSARVGWATGNTLTYHHDGGVGASVSWTPSSGRWYCIRIVRSGTSVSFYVDGVQQGTTQTLAANTAFTLRYVAQSIDSTDRFNGDLAEVMIATSSSFESSGYGLALQDFLYARYLGAATSSGLTTMALSSLLVEFHTSSSFGASGTRWALQSYGQTGRRVLKWYTREPDSVVPAATAALRATPDAILDLFFQTSFWRLTLPASGVLDSDGDGVIDTYHELGVPWFGNYTELPIDFGLSIEVVDPSGVSQSDAGARFVDRLPTFHEITLDASANEEAVSYALLDEIDAAGSSRLCLLDVWAPRTDAALRAMGCYYGNLDKGTKLQRRIVGRDDLSITFVEARA